MSIVAFKLWGDYAHFSHPATIYSSLTYPVPPKTAIMGFLGALIGVDEYQKLNNILYSVKINKEIVKKSFVFNGIKFALASSMHLKEGYQDASQKKQFYRELICSPEYIIFLDLSFLEDDLKNKIIHALKEHKSCYTPYLGINFCIADFEWIEIKKIEQIKDKICKIDTFTKQEDFVFEDLKPNMKLTTARMPCKVENGRIFRDFYEFVIEINSTQPIFSKNQNHIYRINDYRVYFV